MIKLRKNSQ